MKRRAWIVGAGKRVKETALPAFRSLEERFEVAGVLGRSARELVVEGRALAVRPLASLAKEELAPGDLVYVAVGKDAMPAVLRELERFDRARLELLVDTPVLKMKHLRHRALLDGWTRASVAEDVCWLPWHDAVNAACASRFGAVRALSFDRSAYAYHGFAQAKTLLGSKRVVRARRVRRPSYSRRDVWLEGGGFAAILEPRDYAVGSVGIECERGRIADRPMSDHRGKSGRTALLAPIVEDGRCVGFRVEATTTRLVPEEAELTRGDPPGVSVTARMESMKRVGFRRLLERVHAGHGAYPIDEALDDMAADWFLERFGRYAPNALTDVRRPLARGVWSSLGRFA